MTDPPYHLTSIVKRMSADNAAPVGFGSDGRFRRLSGGFMGQKWDGGDVAFRPETWAHVYRVLKPGAHLVAFGGTRTYHRMACAIEDAGFEVRDCIMWLYGSGFPKSHNIGNGWGTALKPACEPIVMARKPLSEKTIAANVLRWGTGALNIDGCRVAGTFESGWSKSGSKGGPNTCMSGPNYEREPKPDNASGRWPANVCHDGSDEVVREFPDLGRAGVAGTAGRHGFGTEFVNGGHKEGTQLDPMTYGDSGSAARFFYCAKASRADRGPDNKHPTVKPTKLMQWLCRMITPPRGLILDPFAGSGSTGRAAALEGFDFVGIEMQPEYAEIAKRRIAAAQPEPDLLAL